MQHRRGAHQASCVEYVLTFAFFLCGKWCSLDEFGHPSKSGYFQPVLLSCQVNHTQATGSPIRRASINLLVFTLSGNNVVMLIRKFALSLNRSSCLGTKLLHAVKSNYRVPLRTGMSSSVVFVCIDQLVGTIDDNRDAIAGLDLDDGLDEHHR